mmetsp:Transcript_18477/g.32604  ORF Transcript_18477/g.32604 Transcript_18477/m.32604 type:complete len:495 (-) Transcript_18477:72-1556(-)
MMFTLFVVTLQCCLLFFSQSSSAFQSETLRSIVSVRRKIPGIVRRHPSHHVWFQSQLRGGSVQQTLDEGEEISSAEKSRRRGMSLALASSYLAVMGAKCALPSVLSLLTSTTQGMTFVAADNTTPQSQMANLLGLSTLAVASGKLLLGPVIDAIGGIRAFQASLLSLMGCLFMISCTQQFKIFSVAWIFVDFIFSACWAAAINAIHQSFPENEWGRQIGFLATGARIGNAASFSLFATILYFLEGQTRQPWRVVFQVSAVLQALPLVLLSYYGGMTLKRGAFETYGQESQSNSFEILKRELLAPQFWLHLISRSSLMVFASFLLFVPTLMNKVYGTSNAVAAQIAAIYSMGCLLSISFGAPIYSSLPKKKKIMAIVSLLGLATLCSLIQLAHVSGNVQISPAIAALSMFLWGFAFTIPFYLPPSLYALERGGRKGSATISDGFDFLGFTLLAVFNGYVASIRHAQPAAWIGCFQFTTLCSIIALIMQPLAVFLQ